MKPRVLVALVAAAAACGAHKGTTTSTNSGTGAALTTGSAGGSVFATGASGAGCGMLGSGDGGAAAACAGAPSGVSYAKDVAPIFAGCMGDVCHAPWTRDNALNVPSTECCDKRPFIKPGDPNGSYIVDKIEGRVCTGRPMPADMTPLTQDQQKVIVGWVCEGAPDN